MIALGRMKSHRNQGHLYLTLLLPMKKNDKFRSTHYCKIIAKMYKIPAEESKIIQIIGKKVINRHSRHYITHLIRKQEYPTFGWIPWSWFRYFYMVLMGSCLFKKKNQKINFTFFTALVLKDTVRSFNAKNCNFSFLQQHM